MKCADGLGDRINMRRSARNWMKMCPGPTFGVIGAHVGVTIGYPGSWSVSTKRALVVMTRPPPALGLINKHIKKGLLTSSETFNLD